MLWVLGERKCKVRVSELVSAAVDGSPTTMACCS